MKRFFSMLLIVAISFATKVNAESQSFAKKDEKFNQNFVKKFGGVENYHYLCNVKQINLNIMQNFKNVSELVTNLNEIKGGVSFVNIIYTNQQNEKQQTTINVGVSYEKAKEKDIEYLKTLDVKTLKSELPAELLEEARIELLNALIKPNKNQSEGQKNAYEHLLNGVKMHKETEEIFIFGMKVKKTVLNEGEYKEDTRKPLTKAKDLIRGKMKSAQYRQYKVNKTSRVKLRGEELIFED